MFTKKGCFICYNNCFSLITEFTLLFMIILDFDISFIA